MAIDISKIAPKTTKNKGGKELRFIKKHAVSIATDANKDQNDPSKKMKMSNRNPLHGYNPGQDERVYESIRYWSSPKKTHIVHGDLSNSQGMKKEKVSLRVRASGKPQALKVAKEHWEEHGWKVDNVKHHRIIEEGYYKNKDIDNQEAAARKKSTKSLMMDKIAKSQHHMSKDGKNIALRHLKGMKNDDYIDESRLDEISSKKMLNYISAASLDAMKNAYESEKDYAAGDKKSWKKKFDKSWNRQAGISKAAHKISTKGHEPEEDEDEDEHHHMKESAEDLFEDWRDHKDHHGNSADHYSRQIQHLCHQLHGLCSNEFDVYHLKSIHRQLEDMYEGLDSTVCNKRREKQLSATPDTVASSSYPMKEDLNEGLISNVKNRLSFNGKPSKRNKTLDQSSKLKNLDSYINRSKDSLEFGRRRILAHQNKLGDNEHVNDSLLRKISSIRQTNSTLSRMVDGDTAAKKSIQRKVKNNLRGTKNYFKGKK